MRNAEKRRVVLEEFHQFYEHEVVPGLRRGGMYLNTDAMADEIVRLRESLASRDDQSSDSAAAIAASARANRILAALREPSEGMQKAAMDEYWCPFRGGRKVWIRVIRAAVKTAEQEVGP